MIVISHFKGVVCPNMKICEHLFTLMLQKEYKRRNVEKCMIDVTMEEISDTALE